MKYFILVLSVMILCFCLYETYKVHVKSTKEIIDGYFIGKIIDKGTGDRRSPYKISSYRWIVADWTTKDGKYVGEREINAAGRPINVLKIGDTIRANGVNAKGFFWFNFSEGLAYYPTQITPIEMCLAVITQAFVYAFLIWLILVIVHQCRKFSK